MKRFRKSEIYQLSEALAMIAESYDDFEDYQKKEIDDGLVYLYECLSLLDEDDFFGTQGLKYFVTGCD